MRSHPFGNVHHMQLEISPGYTEPFVPLKTEEFHSDVHPMAPNPLPTPPQESLTRVQQLFNLASQCHKDGKTLKKKKTIETSLMISKCEVFNLFSHPEAG